MRIVASSSSGEEGLNQSLGDSSWNQKFRTWSGAMSVITVFVVMALCVDFLIDECSGGRVNVRLPSLRSVIIIPMPYHLQSLQSSSVIGDG